MSCHAISDSAAFMRTHRSGSPVASGPAWNEDWLCYGNICMTSNRQLRCESSRDAVAESIWIWSGARIETWIFNFERLLHRKETYDNKWKFIQKRLGLVFIEIQYPDCYFSFNQRRRNDFKSGWASLTGAADPRNFKKSVCVCVWGGGGWPQTPTLSIS